MSKTVEDLAKVFRAALFQHLGNNPYATVGEGDRAGVIAVVTALRDEIADGNSFYKSLFNEILAPREGVMGPSEVGGRDVFSREGHVDGGTRAPLAPPAPAAPAPVCEWTGISEMGDIVHYTTKHGVTNDLNMWRRDKTCAFCNLPIKFTEAQR